MKGAHRRLCVSKPQLLPSTSLSSPLRDWEKMTWNHWHSIPLCFWPYPHLNMVKCKLAWLIHSPCTFLEVVDKLFLDANPSFLPGFKNGTYCCVRGDGWLAYSCLTLERWEMEFWRDLTSCLYLGLYSMWENPFYSPLDNGCHWICEGE